MDFVKGQLVRAKAGRDQGRTLAVLEAQGDQLLLADGKHRTLAKPKRKKAKHVAPTAIVLPAAELATDRLLQTAIAAYDAAHPLGKRGTAAALPTSQGG